MEEKGKLSIVMPVYNEIQTLETAVQRVLCAHPPHLEKELIIVDDGSSDGTEKQLKAIQETYPNVKVFRHERNRGKGAALRTGLQAVTGNIVIIQDADLEYNPLGRWMGTLTPQGHQLTATVLTKAFQEIGFPT
jgi:glycosyltransferase involved in cell wall biosynthesis